METDPSLVMNITSQSIHINTHNGNNELQYEELRAQLYFKRSEEIKIKENLLAQQELEKQNKKEQSRRRKEELKQKENERKAREEAERKELEQKLKDEQLKREAAIQKQKEELERKIKEEEKRLREEAERKRKEELERKRKEEEKRLREEAERKQKEEAERKAREEAEKKRIEEEKRKLEEQIRKEKEEIERKRKEAERKQKEEEKKKQEEKERQEREEKLRIQREKELEEEKERERLAREQEFKKYDLSALEIETSDQEIDLSSDSELRELSFDHVEVEADADDKTVVLDNNYYPDDDIFTRSGSSMFNILDKTSYLNVGTETISAFQPDKTVTIFSKRAENLIKDSFSGPLSDDDDSDESTEEEEDEEEETHHLGFTDNIPTPLHGDPLASFDICQDNDSSAPFNLQSFIHNDNSSEKPLMVFNDENQFTNQNSPKSNRILQELPITKIDNDHFEVLTDPLPIQSDDEDDDDISDNNGFVIYNDENNENIFHHNDENNKKSPIDEFYEDDENKENEEEFIVYSTPKKEKNNSKHPIKQTKSNPPSSPFVILQDENLRDIDDIFALGDDDSSTFAVYKSPQSQPKSTSFSIFQDSSVSNTLNNSLSDFEFDDIELSTETRSEDIFALIDNEISDGSDNDDDDEEEDNTSDIFQDDEIVLYSELELEKSLNYPQGLNPYTCEHANELQSLPKFQSFMQKQKIQETYIKWEEEAPKSKQLKTAPKRMRSTKFKEEDFQEFPLFVGDKKSVTNNSVLTLGPCIGSGGFAKVFLVHHFLEMDSDQDTMFVEETKRALKFQKHSEDPWAIRWEFYLMNILRERLSILLSKNNLIYNYEYMNQRYCSSLYLREFTDSSFLMLSYLDQGTLFDLINAHRVKKRKIEESLIAFLSLEILSIIYGLHRCNIIHGDIKPDNFLFMNENTPGTWEEWENFGHPSWKLRGLQLIDFGRALDLSLYKNKENQVFTGDNHVKELQCIEMRERKPWSYQVDIFGACAIIHLLLFLEPLQLIVKKPSRKCSQVSSECYLPKETFKRYWSFNWELLFIDLLNIENPNASSCTKTLEKHIDQLQDFVGKNSKKIRVALSKEHQLMHDQGF